MAAVDPDGNGAPTAISQRCPGWPCAGFIAAEPAFVLDTGSAWFDGSTDGLPVGSVNCRLTIVGPVAGFSRQEVKHNTQKTTAAKDTCFMELI